MHPVLLEVLNKGYVHLKGCQGDTLQLAKSFGEVFQPHPADNPVVTMKIEGDDPSLTPYASCRTPALSLHTDYATFDKPPRFTLTHCIQPDPGFPQKGISLVYPIQHVIEHLKYSKTALLQLLRQSVFPFCRNVEQDRYHSNVKKFPIIDTKNCVRFDSTLILPSLSQGNYPKSEILAEAVQLFEELCSLHADLVQIPLNRSELLIVDNHKVLHSRSDCTLPTGDKYSSREVGIAFLN
jgi:alpha-ketoglutarate-dependent taurine dioxygenase